MIFKTKEYQEEFAKAKKKFYDLHVEGRKKELRAWAKNYLVVSYIDSVLDNDDFDEEREFEFQLCDAVATDKAIERLSNK